MLQITGSWLRKEKYKLVFVKGPLRALKTGTPISCPTAVNALDSPPVNEFSPSGAPLFCVFRSRTLLF